MRAQNQLTQKLEAFISKYYKNLLLKGVLYFMAVFLLFFLLISFAEHFGNFGTATRTALFWSFICINALILWKWIAIPLKGLYRIGETLSQEEAAKIIGAHFKEVEDKLLNLLQLAELSKDENELVNASIQQKSEQLSPVPFTKAIDFSENKQYLKYALLPLAILLFLFFSGNKKIVTESSARILSHNTHFEPKAPFRFVLENETLSALKGQDFLLKMHFEGSEIPKSAHVFIDGNKYRLTNKDSLFTYSLKNLQKEVSFQFWANGFFSQTWKVTVVPKPIVNSFQVNITSPAYTEIANDTLFNQGNLRFAEGARLKWIFETVHTKALIVRMDTLRQFATEKNGVFTYQNTFYESQSYGLFVTNNETKGDSIFYTLEVIPDAFPSISITEVIDSNDHYLRFYEGSIQDDYGMDRLTFNYRKSTDALEEWQSTELDISDERTQTFFHYWNLEDIRLAPGEKVEYFFEVWDNDAINGSKSTRSTVMRHKTPSEDEQEELTEKNNRSLKNKIEETLKIAEEVQQEMNELDRQLIEEKELRWEDKQKAQSLLDKQQKLQEKISDIQQQQAQNQLEENRFKKLDEEMLKKQQMLQKLFEEIMTDEMKEMMEELQKMMDDIDKDQLQEMLDELEKNDDNIEKELDRSLELFKQLELQQKLENTIEKLNELSKKQEELAEETDQNKTDKEALLEAQKQLEEEFEKVQEELNKAAELNEELEEKQELPEMQSLEEQVQQEMQESLEQLQKNKSKKSAESQKNAAQKMEEMSQKLQSSMQQSEADSNAEDMTTLRQILENLITLSLDQESLLSDIAETKESSPMYVRHMQQQKKLQNDAQIIEDSLFALSKRQPQISSIVNREVSALNEGMINSLEWMAERANAKASEQQQFAMTSANNLALLLSETLKQMQQQMSQQSDSQSKKMCNKPNSTGGQSMKQLKNMQEQLRKQMEQMMKNQQGKGNKGKGDKGKGKELAQMAAKQEMIRKRMQELRQELSGDQQAKQNIDRMLQQMEETETDIINRNISQQTLKRQEEILDKLLDAEKASREREKEERRESNEWLENLSNKLLDPLEKYQRDKKRQEELLRTIPPSLNPFYKNKVNEFFKEDGK